MSLENEDSTAIQKDNSTSNTKEDKMKRSTNSQEENGDSVTINKEKSTSNVHEDEKNRSSTSTAEEGKLQAQYHKKYLGGYRHKLTGKIYHHAMVQTNPPPWKYNSTIKFNRDAQTSVLQDKAQQTPKDASTQVDPQKIFLIKTGFKTLEANKNYKSYDDIKKEYINKIITLQKYARRWLAQQELLKRKKEVLLRNFWEEKEKNYKTQEDFNWLRSLEERKLNPSSHDDFKLLFSDLQNWWQFQANCISNARSGADLKAAMWLLLNFETKRIEDINRKKKEVVQKKNSDNREMLLETAAKPKLWKANGKKIQVETRNTQKASHLHDLYTTLSMKHVPAQERVDALISLKEFLQPYKSKLTDDLILLANREIDLHLRGIKAINMEGLQTRIRDLIWQFSKKPIYNPEMQKLSKLSTQNGSLPHILCCAACNCFYILPNDSTVETLGKSVLENYSTKCKKCLSIENEAWIRKDLELYKRILKLLIQEEETKPTTSSIIYILQPKDIGFLVEKIWKHQSCISGSSKEIELEFIRYNTNKNWTPWNCLLVTRQEAKNLSNIPNSEKKFDKKFKKCIFQNHTEARRYFSTIPRFIPYLNL